MKIDLLTGLPIKYVCGGCTACCTTHGVESIEKLPRHGCKFCTAGSGCAVYETRPTECQEFICAWLVGKGGGPDLRPDKLGVVVNFFIDHEALPGVVTIFSEFRKGALNSEVIFKWTRNILFRGSYVIHHPSEGDEVFLYLPRGAEPPPDLGWVTSDDGKTIWCVTFEAAIRGLVL